MKSSYSLILFLLFSHLVEYLGGQVHENNYARFPTYDEDSGYDGQSNPTAPIETSKYRPMANPVKPAKLSLNREGPPTALPRSAAQLRTIAGGVQGDPPPAGFPTNPAEAHPHQQMHQNQFDPSHHPNNPQVAMQAQPNVLMKSVGNSAIAVVYIIMMWRSMHNYELADQISNRFLRYCSVVPTVVLFLMNIVGLMLTFMKAERQKRNMKAILNMNALNELTLLVYNLYRMVLGANIWTPREVYVGRVLVNFWFLSLWFTFVKTRWITDGTLDAAARHRPNT